jgi:branched-chain amino acid aminotransferase
MVNFVSINGRLVSSDAAYVPANDRGFTLGDGLFETIRVSAGRPLMLSAHLQRLQRGASVLELALPSLQGLTNHVWKVVRANQLPEAVVRLSVSRGSGQRGLAPTPGLPPTVVIAMQPFNPYPPRWYDEGVRAVTTTVTRNESSPLSSVKSLSYADQVLARIQAQGHSADLGLMRNTREHFVCADCANLFVVQGDRLLTPSIAAGALPGIARQVLLWVAGGLGLDVSETELSQADFHGADEIMLTNVLLEVAPLVSLDGLPVGGGKPGHYVALLRRAYRLAVGI